jgi:hypothetical protein
MPCPLLPLTSGPVAVNDVEQLLSYGRGRYTSLGGRYFFERSKEKVTLVTT